VISADRGFPYQLIWRTPAPVKVAFLVWEASHEKILTIDNLQRGGSPRFIGVSCAKTNLKQWITCCFSARLLGFLGCLLSIVWGFVRLYLTPLEVIFWRGRVCLAGRWEKRTRQGGWYPMLFFGVYGGSVIFWGYRNLFSILGRYSSEDSLFLGERKALLLLFWAVFLMLGSLYMGCT